jgi:hypothetical protein
MPEGSQDSSGLRRFRRWLELTQGDKRDLDTAAQVRDYIVRGVGGDRWPK